MPRDDVNVEVSDGTAWNGSKFWTYVPPAVGSVICLALLWAIIFG